MRTEAKVSVLSLLLFVLLAACRGSVVERSPTVPPASQAAGFQDERHALTPAAVVGSWRSVKLHFDETYSEVKWHRLDLEIGRLSDVISGEGADPADWAVLGRRAIIVVVYGYRDGKSSRVRLRDWSPGWFEKNEAGTLMMCVGPIGSHYRMPIRVDADGLLHLEGSSFRASLRREHQQ